MKQETTGIKMVKIMKPIKKYKRSDVWNFMQVMSIDTFLPILKIMDLDASSDNKIAPIDSEQDHTIKKIALTKNDICLITLFMATRHEITEWVFLKVIVDKMFAFAQNHYHVMVPTTADCIYKVHNKDDSFLRCMGVIHFTQNMKTKGFISELSNLLSESSLKLISLTFAKSAQNKLIPLIAAFTSPKAVNYLTAPICYPLGRFRYSLLTEDVLASYMLFYPGIKNFVYSTSTKFVTEIEIETCNGKTIVFEKMDIDDMLKYQRIITNFIVQSTGDFNTPRVIKYL